MGEGGIVDRFFEGEEEEGEGEKLVGAADPIAAAARWATTSMTWFSPKAGSLCRPLWTAMAGWPGAFFDRRGRRGSDTEASRLHTCSAVTNG